MATNFPTSLDALRTNQGLTDGVSIIQAAPHNNLMDAVDALEAQVGADSSAVLTTLDYRVSHKGAYLSGATVFNTHLTAAGTWQDLDLSAIVGAEYALAFLEVTCNTAGLFLCKPKGYGAAYANHSGYTGTGAPSYGECGCGCCEIGYTAASSFHYVLCATDSSGVIQIACSNNTSILTIKIIGYIR
jgi:hypothetical protein